MKKFKDFFDKKQSEIKFKNAGAGHKLSDSSKMPGPSFSNRSSTDALHSNTRRTGPDANVASAALARIEKKDTTNKVTSKTTLHDIMAEEKRKITENMKLKDQLEEQKNSQIKKLEEEQSNPFKVFEKSQRFVCPTLNMNDPLPFNELICQIKANIFDNFGDDPLLRSAMILFNCNREINSAISSNYVKSERLQSCLDVLAIIAGNLQTEKLEDLEKFKRIRRSKIEKKVLSLDGALDLLFAVGFTIDTDVEWLSYVEVEGEDLHAKMSFLKEMLQNPQIIPIELDRQIRRISATFGQEDSSEDLRLTSVDFKKFYSNLEKNREINEMLISKETKAKMISGSTICNPIFTKLRFKFSVTGSDEIEIIEANFFSTEKLSDVKSWFTTNFAQLFEAQELRFKSGPDMFLDEHHSKSLLELKLSPAATLLVYAK